MNKFLKTANRQHFSAKLVRALLVLLVGLTLGFGYCTATADPTSAANTKSDNGNGHDNGNDKNKNNDKDKDKDKDKKCEVCHNEHEIHIPCKQVADYLRQHPGDHAGDCEASEKKNK